MATASTLMATLALAISGGFDKPAIKYLKSAITGMGGGIGIWKEKNLPFCLSSDSYELKSGAILAVIFLSKSNILNSG